MAIASKGNFVWYEHLTKDTNKAMAFYGEVMGWKTEAFGDKGYSMWVGTSGPLGGVMTLPPDAEKMGAPPHWMGSVCVDNVDASVAKVTELGGKVYMAATDIPEVGRYAVVADAQGASFSLFKPAKPMEMHDLGKPGEFCWNELVTSDSEAAFKFYAEVFGWKLMDEMDMGPMGKYRIFGVGETRVGGMMTTPPGNPMPPAWMYYASTDNLEASMKRATQMGAKVMNGPMDVPGGRIAQLMDPQGAAFALHQAAKTA